MSEPSHSKFSASAAARWLACPGSMVLSAGKSDKPSVYAAWGTVAHALADDVIADRCASAALHLGDIHLIDGHTITVDDEMVDCVNTYLRNLREMTQGADILTGEMRVNYSNWLGVEHDQAWGTADAIAVVGTELQVHDLKTGMGVEVDAEQNVQMMLYAGGALNEYDMVADIQTVRLVIHQPRVKSAPSEWALSVDELKEWLTGRARSGAVSVRNAEKTCGPEWEQAYLSPGEKQCKFCKAKATCPALRSAVLEPPFGGTVDVSACGPDEFANLTDIEVQPGDQTAEWLAACLSKVDMIEDWCKAVRAETERRLLAGEPVPGYKLVQGKRGARQWSDAAAAEKMLREQFRLPIEKAYDLKLINPTTAEKLAKAGDIGPRQWPKAAALITQSEGKAHVAPSSDPRPAIDIRPVVEDFDNVADIA